MTTKNYQDSVEAGFVFWDNVPKDGTVVEELVMIGYLAGIQDSYEAVKKTATAAGFSEGASRFFAIARDKFSSLTHKASQRAKELKV
jgi:hypothetical protein